MIFLKQVIICTPGRLWALMTDHTEGIGSYLKNLKCLDMLIIDEADRMVEAGHFNGKIS